MLRPLEPLNLREQQRVHIQIVSEETEDEVQALIQRLVAKELQDSNQDSLTFICADDRLLAAAQAEGLLTDNPNYHP